MVFYGKIPITIFQIDVYNLQDPLGTAVPTYFLSTLLCLIYVHLFIVTGKYYGMDHDAYQHEIEEECLKESGHTLPEDKTYESQMSYNPYDLHMGQMTVYR